jgi:hypothetical protein
LLVAVFDYGCFEKFGLFIHLLKFILKFGAMSENCFTNPLSTYIDQSVGVKMLLKL